MLTKTDLNGIDLVISKRITQELNPVKEEYSFWIEENLRITFVIINDEILFTDTTTTTSIEKCHSS